MNRTITPDAVFLAAGFTSAEVSVGEEGPEAVKLDGRGPVFIISYDRYVKSIQAGKILTSFEYDQMVDHASYVAAVKVADPDTTMKIVKTSGTGKSFSAEGLVLGSGGSSDVIVTLPGKHLTDQEWANILELIKNERGWSEEDLMNAIKEDGWMNQQRKEEKEIEDELEQHRKS